MITYYSVQTVYGTRYKQFMSRWQATKYFNKLVADMGDSDLVEVGRHIASVTEFNTMDFDDQYITTSPQRDAYSVSFFLSIGICSMCSAHSHNLNKNIFNFFLKYMLTTTDIYDIVYLQGNTNLNHLMKEKIL